MEDEVYLGIRERTSAEIKRSGSTFTAVLSPCLDAEDVKSTLKEVQESHPDASHYCYAYVLGLNREEQYSSDAGEPSGSAGRPILGALLSSGLSNICCVVIRYFGGKKLGIPGLIEAYRTSTELAIDQAIKEEIQLLDELRCWIDSSMSYHWYNTLNRYTDLQWELTDGIFSLRCPKSMTGPLREELSKIPTLAWKE